MTNFNTDVLKLKPSQLKEQNEFMKVEEEKITDIAWKEYDKIRTEGEEEYKKKVYAKLNELLLLRSIIR